MTCLKRYDCGSYPQKCAICTIMSGAHDPYPYFNKISPDVTRDNVKFKIFWGNHTNVSADAKLNQWLAENPSVELIEWQYQQVRLGDHSICIAYKEEKENG